MKKTSMKGFTLIELIVVITIIVLMTFTTYIPYSYYGNKVKLSQGVKDIAKTIHEAKNLAMNGISVSESNQSVAVYLDTRDTFHNKIQILSYNNTLSGSHIDRSGVGVVVLKEYRLQPGVQIDELEGQENILIFFHSITGISEQYFWDALGDKVSISSEDIDIEISYKGSTSSSLRKSISYIPKTNIINY